MENASSSTAAYECTIIMKRLRSKIAHHALFDVYAELLFTLIVTGQDYKNDSEWLVLRKQLQALEKSL